MLKKIGAATAKMIMLQPLNNANIAALSAYKNSDVLLFRSIKCCVQLYPKQNTSFSINSADRTFVQEKTAHN